MAIQFIYKICEQAAWEAAVADGLYHGSDLDLKDGFIHFSTAGQAKETASKHFNGISGLVLLKVPVESVNDRLKWEKSRNDDLFPHLYRALRADEVIDATLLELDDRDHHVFPELD